MEDLYQSALRRRAVETGQTLYQQWLVEQFLYGGPSFMVTHPDGNVELLSERDWDITINIDKDQIVSYTVARKKEERNGSSG